MNTIPKTCFIYLFVQTRHKNTTGARDIKKAYCLFVQMFEHRNDNDKSLIIDSILLFGAVFFFFNLMFTLGTVDNIPVFQKCNIYSGCSE